MRGPATHAAADDLALLSAARPLMMSGREMRRAVGV